MIYVLIILALAFTISSHIFKKGYLSFAGGGVWIIASVHCFSNSLATWDTYFSLGFLFVALLFTCIFSPLAWRETTPANEMPEDSDIADLRAEMEAFHRERNQYSFLHDNKRPRRRARW